MGAAIAKLVRPIKNWNIESRAHKVISQDKIKPAPVYPSTKKQIDLVNKLEPDYKINAGKKDLQLDDYLKKVYVQSNEVPQKSASNPDKELPKTKISPPEFEIGFYESSAPPAGKITLSQAMKFITNHSKDPEKYTVNIIAEEYKLDPKVVADILHYNKIFQVKEDERTDPVAKPIPISLKSGATIPYTEKKNVEKKKKNSEKNENIEETKSIKQIQQT